MRTSAYHPQTTKLVEWFNKTLKTMICMFVSTRNWDKLSDPLLFAVREIPLGFPPLSYCMGKISQKHFLQAQGRQKQYNIN